MSRISIIIVTYNSQRWLPGLLSSLNALQPAANQVIVVDNASQDQTVSELKKASLPIQLIENTTNRWFSAAVNQALAKATGQYVLLLNPDATLEATSLQKLSSLLDQHPKTAAVFGKVRRGSTLDSFGINCSRARQFYNRGEGEADSTRFDTQPAFGFSGGGVLLRMDALRGIAIDGEILDEDFEAYKDDVDLSYRLRLAGWDIAALPEVVGQHQRTIDASSVHGDKSAAKNRQRFSPEIRRLSSRNHLWVLLKNEPVSSLLLDSPWIIWYEFKKFAYILIADPRTLIAYGQAILGIPKMLHKRRWIQTHRTISPSTLRQLCQT